MDIARIFKSKTRKKLFRLYFTNPDAEYYMRELERELSTPVSMVRAELKRLEDDGIFISRRKANLRYYRLNKEYPLFAELKSIVFKTVGAEGYLKTILDKIKNINCAFIYGSFARNQEKAASDIDIFIIGKPDQDALALAVRDGEKALNRDINYSVCSRPEFNARKNKVYFLKDILSNPKIFLVGGKNEL